MTENRSQTAQKELKKNRFRSIVFPKKKIIKSFQNIAYNCVYIKKKNSKMLCGFTVSSI